MKTAIYIEDGTVQLVITPESEFEKSSLRSFESTDMTAKIMTGTFYGCQGGWIRHLDQPYGWANDNAERSLILRMDAKKT